MGIFGILKKELYVNRLATVYKLSYDCCDMAAIECLRKNYSTKELREILELLKEAEKKVDINTALNLCRPFKEEYEEVLKIAKNIMETSFVKLAKIDSPTNKDR